MLTVKRLEGEKLVVLLDGQELSAGFRFNDSGAIWPAEQLARWAVLLEDEQLIRSACATTVAKAGARGGSVVWELGPTPHGVERAQVAVVDPEDMRGTRAKSKWVIACRVWLTQPLLDDPLVGNELRAVGWTHVNPLGYQEVVPPYLVFLRDVSGDAVVSEVVEEVEAGLELSIRRAAVVRLAEERPESVVAMFRFPERVRVVCEQYLIYFTEFLRDLVGVDAKSNLQHTTAGEVLLSVAPDAPDVALDRIHEALEIYLRLPGVPALVEPLEPGAPDEARRLRENLDRLLVLLADERRLNEDVARRVDLLETRTAGHDLTRINDVVEALRALGLGGKVDDDERLFGGVVKVKPIDLKVVELDVTRPLVRWLKTKIRWFR